MCGCVHVCNGPNLPLGEGFHTLINGGMFTLEPMWDIIRYIKKVTKRVGGKMGIRNLNNENKKKLRYRCGKMSTIIDEGETKQIHHLRNGLRNQYLGPQDADMASLEQSRLAIPLYLNPFSFA